VVIRQLQSQQSDCKNKYGVTEKWDKEEQEKVWDIERQISKDTNKVIEELVSLGLLKIRLSMATFDGGNSILYDLTELGYQFLKYVKNT
jgi:hypothetical protein